MTHDPLCLVFRPFRPSCECDFIAEIRADERAKYVLPLPRGGDHADFCRDLACYGCEELVD